MGWVVGNVVVRRFGVWGVDARDGVVLMGEVVVVEDYCLRSDLKRYSWLRVYHGNVIGVGW